MWPFKKKAQEFPELKEELLVLSREWFKNQIGNLPEDELPPEKEIEADIVQMRDETFARIISSVPVQRYLTNSNEPADEKNTKALGEIIVAYSGHEDTTPIFTKLALSKVDEPRYQSGWGLCAIRLIAETWLEQSVA